MSLDFAAVESGGPDATEGYSLIKIEGVKKAGDLLDVTVSLKDEDTIDALWDQLGSEGFEHPLSINSTSGLTYNRKSVNNVPHPFDSIKVVEGTPGKDEISVDQRLIELSNDRYGQPLQFNIGEEGVNVTNNPIRTITDGRGFQASFQRTPRMPDDDKLHQLPGSLGAYDIFSVEAYANQLPDKIAAEGGVFLPMWQREALWIDFASTSSWRATAHDSKYAVRIFVGKVNAVSGHTMGEESPEGKHRKQDYVVIPGQEWLDGICVEPGVVRQFVAMPLGSGYTVEGQKTKEEKHGGLQIEVIPAFSQLLRWWSKDTDPSFLANHTGHEIVDKRDGFDEMKTPRELGLEIGDIIRSYPIEVGFSKPVTIKELYEKNPDSPWKAIYTAAPQFRNRSNVTKGPKRDTYHVMSYNNPSIEGMYASFSSSSPSPSTQASNSDSVVQPSSSKAPAPPKLTTKDLKAMGLAAGGKLIQDIYTDRFPPNIWNHSAARIIHVHILDPESCERVTHIVPQPPLTDAKSYAEDGGEFFVVEEQPDSRVDGGDFGDIKSVSAIDRQKLSEPKEQDEFNPLEPRICEKCEVRLCDCVIRPCNHTLCNVCIQSLYKPGICPTCGIRDNVYVAGFSAPMNIPGEEPMRIKVPVHVLKVEDGRVAFKSISRGRI